MNNKILILIPFLLLIPSLSYSEIGPNYDRTQIGPSDFQWTSHYERIWDGQEWVNYILTQNIDKIRFQSSNMFYELDKNDCSFSLYNPDTDKVEIEKFSKSLKINSLDVLLSSCNIDSLEETQDGIKITISQAAPTSEIKTIYDIEAQGSNEWTYEFTNNDLFASKIFTLDETCKNCSVQKIEGDIILFDAYSLDTKNIIHNKLKSVSEGKDLLLSYETGNISYFDKEIIDPVFSSNNPSEDGYIYDSGADNVCSVANARFSANPEIIIALWGASAGDCYTPYSEWDITSIPDTSYITDVHFKFDVNSITNPRNCDYIGMEARPTTATDQQVMNSILGDTVLLSNDSTCTTTGNNKDIDLGTLGNTYIQNKLVVDWAALGVKHNSMIIDASDRYSGIASEEDAGAIPKPTLEITYFKPNVDFYPEEFNFINVGDVGRFNGTIFVHDQNGIENLYYNITSLQLLVNGTIINSNGTNQNQTIPYRVNFGPFWYQMATDNIYNFTMLVTLNNASGTWTNKSSLYEQREYDPDYFTANDPAEGTVNYTFAPNNVIKVNRDQGGATFSIECLYTTQSDAFFNSTANSQWNNATATGFYTNDYFGFYYVQCYNTGELFTTFLAQNYTNQLVPGLVIFDQLGGFMGAPSVILVIIAILSLATGRNFPIIIIIAISVTGILGALQLIILDPSIWGALIITAGITLFGVRKFY